MAYKLPDCLGETKWNLVFLLVNNYGLLYEIANTAANGGASAHLMGAAVDKFGLIPIAGPWDESTTDFVIGPVDTCEDPPSVMAIAFLEWVFNNAPKPAWVPEGI